LLGTHQPLGFAAHFAIQPVKEYLESLKKYPNPPAVNLTDFSGK